MGCCGSDIKSYTIADWLCGRVGLPVADENITSLCVSRGIEQSQPFASVDERGRDLLEADLLVHIATTWANRIGSTTDKDNGWEHTDGGYTLTADDKDRMLARARALYEKWDEEIPFDDDVKITVSSFGIMPCNYNECGIPLPHIERY